MDWLLYSLLLTKATERKKGLLWLTVGGYSPSRQEVMTAGAGGSWSHCVCSQEAEGWMLPPASLILFLHFKTPVYSVMSPTVRVSLQLIKSRNFCISLPPFKIHLHAWGSLGQPLYPLEKPTYDPML